MIVFVSSRKYCVARRGFSLGSGSSSTRSTSVRSTWNFSNRFAGLQDAPRPRIGSRLCGFSAITGLNLPLFIRTVSANALSSHEHSTLSSRFLLAQRRSEFSPPAPPGAREPEEQREILFLV